MSINRKSLIISISLTIIVTILGSSPAFASNNPYLTCPDCNDTSNIQQIPPVAITVTTDKQVYDHNSQIIITGHVTNPYPGQNVFMKITSPSGNIVTTSQVTLSNNEDFTSTVSTVGNLWFENGIYTVSVQQGSEQGRANSATFQLADISTTPPTKIPSWVRHIFIYYGQGDVSEDELLGAIKFLINQGIMKLS